MSDTGTIILQFGVRDGMVIKDVSNSLHSIDVAYIPDGEAVRINPSDLMPTTEIKTQKYRDTYEYDEGMRVFRPEATTK